MTTLLQTCRDKSPVACRLRWGEHQDVLRHLLHKLPSELIHDLANPDNQNNMRGASLSFDALPLQGDAARASTGATVYLRVLHASAGKVIEVATAVLADVLASMWERNWAAEILPRARAVDSHTVMNLTYVGMFNRMQGAVGLRFDEEDGPNDGSCVPSLVNPKP